MTRQRIRQRFAIPRRRQCGFSLVELAVVMVVLGIVGILLARWVGTATGERRLAAHHDLLERADDALLAYAMLNHRLPCPSGDTAGLESGTCGAVGYLPYATLGLPDARAGRIRYGVLRRTGGVDVRVDADLTAARDRSWPLQVSGGQGLELPLANINGLDMCQALRTGMRLPADASFVHTLRSDRPDTLAHNVAYALALPGTPDAPAAEHAGDSLAFASPRHPGSGSYHDTVRATGMDQLWSRMRCGDNLSVADHAHFNVAAAAAVTTLALEDYKRQLAVSLQLAYANSLSGGAAVAGGAGQVASAAAGMADAIAESLASTGAMSWKNALAIGSIATAAVVTVTAATFLGLAEAAHTEAKKQYAAADAPIERMRPLEASIRENARAADAAGMYVDP